MRWWWAGAIGAAKAFFIYKKTQFIPLHIPFPVM
jgi:hypothetical protein